MQIASKMIFKTNNSHNYLKQMKINRLFYYITFFILISCSTPNEETEKFEPSLKKRTEDAAQKGGGIIIFGGDKRKADTLDFLATNVMWRATLKTLNFMPLVSADYSAGLIVTDWYSDQKLSKEQIKIQISFLSNEIRSDSIVINSFKRICESNGQCTNSAVSEKLNIEIKDQIITTARFLKIEEVKNKKP